MKDDDKDDQSWRRPCSRCDGSGQLPPKYLRGTGREIPQTCPDCRDD